MGRKQAEHPNAFCYPGLYVCCWVAVTQAAGGSQKCLCGERSSCCCASVFGTKLPVAVEPPRARRWCWAPDKDRDGSQVPTCCVVLACLVRWWLPTYELLIFHILVTSPSRASHWAFCKDLGEVCHNERGSSQVAFVQMLMGGREGPVPLSHCNPTTG